MTDKAPWQDLWDAILAWLTPLVSPSWGDLIPLLPLVLLLVVVVVLLLLGWHWQRAGALNRARVPARRRDLPPPPGVHLPGPSKWPLVLPVAGAVLLVALVFTPTDDKGVATAPANLPLLLLGLAVAAAGVIGWYRDANREWRVVAGVEPHGAHGDHVAQRALVPAHQAALVAPGLEEGAATPPGIHLPGPSPWPFYGPVALAVIFTGLVFGPAIVVGGIVMGIIAAIGWLLDAGHEYRQVEGGHHAEPRTRDPERAFVKALLPVYALVLVASLGVTAAPNVIALVNPSPSAPASPGASPGGGTGGETGELKVVAAGVKFDQQALTAPADTPFKIVFENRDSVPHNVAIADRKGGAVLFQGELVTATTTTYDVPALPKGELYFWCVVHPTMEGTLTSR